MLFCNSIILRCVDMLYLGEVHDEIYVSNSEIRKTKYQGVELINCCNFTHKINSNVKELFYSPEKKLMLYIFVLMYIQRVKDRKIIIADNYTTYNFYSHSIDKDEVESSRLLNDMVYKLRNKEESEESE